MADNRGSPVSRFAFKAPEFERINPARPLDPEPATRDLSVQNGQDHARIDGASHGQSANHVAPEVRTEVTDVLRANYQREVAAGRFHVPSTPDRKRRQRWRNYLLGMFAANGVFIPLAVISGPSNPFLFVYALAGSAICSSVITWQTWGLRTD